MPQPPAPATPRHPASRYPTIDLLRGLSILAVILLHIWLRFTFAGLDVGKPMPRWPGHLLFRNGGNGVTIFFAISGFLITTTSLQRFGSLAAVRARTFYRIRYRRWHPHRAPQPPPPPLQKSGCTKNGSTSEYLKSRLNSFRRDTLHTLGGEGVPPRNDPSYNHPSDAQALQPLPAL